MRQHYDRQRKFGQMPIAALVLNFDCRDEMVPVLAGPGNLFRWRQR